MEHKTRQRKDISLSYLEKMTSLINDALDAADKNNIKVQRSSIGKTLK